MILATGTLQNLERKKKYTYTHSFIQPKLHHNESSLLVLLLLLLFGPIFKML
jgi:hypothetical protein